MLHTRDVTNPKHMTIIPFAELTTSRQKAILAISAMRRRSDEAMQAAQADHGTQSQQFAEAAARYEQATEMLTEQTQRTRMPEHPLYVSAESAAAYYEATK
jgi:hypothetical protein